MTTADKTTRNLKIEGMSNEADVTKVSGILKNVSGLSNQSVKVGSASIHANKADSDAACKAITGAGFKTHEPVAAK